MSEVYWGIVVGLLAMVTTLIISIRIYYGSPSDADWKERKEAGSE